MMSGALKTGGASGKRVTFLQMTLLDGEFVRKKLEFGENAAPGVKKILNFEDTENNSRFSPNARCTTLQKSEDVTWESVRSPLKPLGPNLPFPVVKRGPQILTAKPLVIGGAGKRYSSGRCVSDALVNLKFSDEENVTDNCVRKKLHTLRSSQSNVPASTVLPIVPVCTKNVIGDHSCNHLLPTVRGSQTDLKCIKPSTLSSLVKKELHPEEIERFWVVDCRYPYEFDAGHIRGAINIYQRHELKKLFFDQPYLREDPTKRLIIIFHCEFSSHRGPSMARYMRSEDRLAHKNSYPSLAYPEVYLLNGGYKSFFEVAQDLCEPPFYTPMSSELHRYDLSHFKAKAKSAHELEASSRHS